MTSNPGSTPSLGDLATVPALERPDLLAESTAAALSEWQPAAHVGVAQIDPGLADTAALVQAYGLTLPSSGNCVIVSGARAGDERISACVVPADTRADVNGLVRKRLDVRKCSFHPMERAVAETGMEYGGITPLGLPPTWVLLVDADLLSQTAVVVGSGVRHSKLVLPGALLAELPGVEIVEGLGRPIPGVLT